MSEITVEDLENLKDENNHDYIKSGWIDFKNFAKIHITNMSECINNCQSPRVSKNGQTSEDDLKIIFKAFSLFPLNETRVLIIGQDPYPDVNRAHGLAFSFADNKKPADDSLLNIFKAIQAYNTEKEDIANWNTNLEKWAKENKVLLLNTALTYEKTHDIEKKEIKKAQNKLYTKHKNIWKPLFNEIIKNLVNNNKICVFLWGQKAQKAYNNAIKNVNVNENVKVYKTSHPSNNGQAVKKGFSDDAPNHFKACDKFLGANPQTGKYIWKDFPENNK